MQLKIFWKQNTICNNFEATNDLIFMHLMYFLNLGEGRGVRYGPVTTGRCEVPKHLYSRGSPVCWHAPRAHARARTISTQQRPMWRVWRAMFDNFMNIFHQWSLGRVKDPCKYFYRYGSDFFLFVWIRIIKFFKRFISTLSLYSRADPESGSLSLFSFMNPAPDPQHWALVNQVIH